MEGDLGFFFKEEEPTKKQKGIPRQLSMDTLYQVGCKACPLNKVKHLRHPKLDATGSKKPLIYMLGEANGENEDKLGKQFVGKAGQLLRKYLPDDIVESARWNNTINCWPGKGNPNPSPVELACCRPRIVEDIEKSKPKAIFGFGNVPLKWALDEDRISKWRGMRVPIRVGSHTCWYYPMFHPSFISRGQKKNPRTGRIMRGENEIFFERDIERAIDEIDDLPNARIPSLKDIESGVSWVDSSGGWGDVKQIQRKLYKLGEEELIAFDYETASDEPDNRDRRTKPYGRNARILSVAVAGEKESFAFPLRHREAKWTKSQLEAIEKAWSEFLFSKAQKIAQYLIFELEWSIYFFGLSAARASKWHDTMAQAYVIGQQRGTMSLDALTMINFGFRLKNVCPVNTSNLDQESLEKVLKYNALDSKWEREVFLTQERRIIDEGLEDSYTEQVRRTSTMALKSHFGMLIDFDAIVEFDKDYSPRIESLEAWFENSSAAAKFEKRFGKKFKPSSPLDVLKMFRNVLGRKECKVKSKDRGDPEDKWSVEDAVLEKIPLTIAKKMQEYRAIRGNKSKYVDNLTPKNYMPSIIAGKKSEIGRCIWPDGLTHATLHHQDLVTRRTSCSFPNEQFWPGRDENFISLRKTFAAPTRKLLERLKKNWGYDLPSHFNEDDCWFVAIDYGQIQARIAGMLSNDYQYCMELWDRLDTHMRWTKRIAKAYPRRIGGSKFLKDKDVMKTFRKDVKNQWTFPLIFGATANSVSGYLNIPVDVLNPLIEEFFDEMPGLKKWQTKTRKHYDEYGYVEGPMGWRRYGPLGHGEVINTPIQNGEAEIVLDSMTRLSEAAQDLNAWQFQARLEVHDELGFWIPKKTVDRDLEFIADFMLECEHFDWINVPLLIEISKGSNWFDQGDNAEIYSDDIGKLDRKECGF